MCGWVWLGVRLGVRLGGEARCVCWVEGLGV